MPQLPRIVAPAALTVPEIVYPDLYIVSLYSVVEDRLSMRQSLRLTLQAYNHDTQQVSWSPEHQTKVDILDVFTESARVPRLGAVMAEISATINLYLQEKALRAAYTTLIGTAGFDMAVADALRADLHEVETALGMPLT
jgi:hypothetical protein